MRKTLLTVIGLTLLAISGFAVWNRPDLRLQTGSGLTSHLICSGVFVSGLPAERVYEDMVLPIGAMASIKRMLRFKVDEAAKTVETTIAGLFFSKAVYREGSGCHLRHEGWPDDTETAAASIPFGPSLLPDIVATDARLANKNLETALDRAFTEPSAPPYNRTQAVVIVHHGKIVAERYAPGIEPDTPLLSWSMAKSVTNAMIGILVQQGRLKTSDHAPIPVWRSARDSHAAITLDMLLRQTSGLAFAQTNTGDDPGSRMKYLEVDMAAYAAQADVAAEPGQRWAYSDGNFMLLSRIVRDAVGGRARDVKAFADRELFGPLGMSRTTLEFDETGTPLGAYSFYASARDWARFGLLYLNDGVVGGRRILPEGWVGYSATPTLETSYGAGFWTNRNPDKRTDWGKPRGLPHAPQNTFFARGFMGQYVVVIPSKDIVIVRLGPSQLQGGGFEGLDGLVGEVLAALGG